MLQMAWSNPAIGQALAAALADVQERFAKELVSDLACVNSLATHVERYHGKMLRPMLVLTAGMATGPGDGAVTPRHRILATVVEMIHMASLVHDDILDEAEIRRRGTTVNHLRGNEAAVMLGDYLVSHAYHLCAALDDNAVNRMLSQATNALCEGELLQLANRNNWAVDEALYLEMIRRKTAVFCGACARGGAMLSAAAPPVAEALYVYGERLGMAFQIVDDLLDLTGNEDTVGKTLGRDLQKGKLTLPLIHLLASGSAEDRRRLLELLQSPAPHDGELQPVVRRLVSDGGSVAYAQRRAQELVEQAQAALACLSPTPAKTLLTEVAQNVLTRRF